MDMYRGTVRFKAGAVRQVQGGRAKGRSMDVVKKDMGSVDVREEDAEDRERWRQMIGCGHPSREQPKGDERRSLYII